MQMTSEITLLLANAFFKPCENAFQQFLLNLPKYALEFLWILQFYLFIFISILQLGSFYAAWYRNRKEEFPTGVNFFEPEVSVIVCTKDEEDNIGRLLNGLIQQEYPKEKYEIIVVDESTDKTPEIVQDIIQNNSKTKISLLSRFELPPKPENYNPVAYGITQAVLRAKYEIIIVTEADCVHAPQYLRFFVQPYNPNYSRRHVGAVGSHPVFIGETKNTLGANIQRLDFSGNVFHNFAGLDAVRDRAGVSTGLWGGSLSFKKSVFQDIGGYEGIEHHHVHDIMITDRIVKHNYRVIMLFDRRVKVETIASPTVKAAINQRFRWYKAIFSIGRWDAIMGPTLYSLLPWLFENIAILLIITSGVLLIFPNPFHMPHELIFTLILMASLLVILYVYRYIRFYQISHYRIFLKEWKNKKTAILLFGFVEWINNWVFFLSVFRRTIIWR